MYEQPQPHQQTLTKPLERPIIFSNPISPRLFRKMLFSSLFEQKLINLSYTCSFYQMTLLMNAFNGLKHLTNHSDAIYQIFLRIN